MSIVGAADQTVSRHWICGLSQMKCEIGLSMKWNEKASHTIRIEYGYTNAIGIEYWYTHAMGIE